jgi:hypothetical protein
VNDKPENATFNQTYNDIKVISSDNYNKPLIFKDKTLFVNLNLINKLKMPAQQVGYYNIIKDPILYDYQENRSNIVIVGDSYSEGGGIRYSETFPYFLSKRIKMNVINLGVGGYGSKKEIERFNEMGLRYKPKIVILQYCSNDFENTEELWSLLWNSYYLLKENGYDCKNDWFHGNPIYMNLYELYLDSLGRDKLKFLQQNVQEPLEKLNLIKEKYNFRVIMMDFGLPSEEKLFIKNIAKKYNWILLDLDKELSFKYEVPYILSKRNIHFSSWFNSQVAQLLSENINRIK